jgi:Protein of unknown function (DUF1499)
MAQIFFTKSKQPPSVLATLGLVILFLSATILAAAGPLLGHFQQTSGVPEEIFLWRLKLVELSRILLLCGSAVTFLGILHGRFSSRVRTSWRGFLAAGLALPIAIPLWFFDQAQKTGPLLHDISTNVTDPPYFQQLPERSYDTSKQAKMLGGRLDTSYKERHQKMYPTLKPLRLMASPEQTLNAARRTAERLGWTVKTPNSNHAQIEARYIHPYLQLPSNIAIRARPLNAGKYTVLDIRAVSDVGNSDYGQNSALITDFLAEIQKEVPLLSKLVDQ